MKKLSYVGRSLPRKDALIKATGRARYADDQDFAGMLYAAAVRCPKPRIKILAISDSKAKKVPGYVTLVTFKDVKGANKWPLVVNDYPFLPEREARFQGETEPGGNFADGCEPALVLAPRLDVGVVEEADNLVAFAGQPLGGACGAHAAADVQDYFHGRTTLTL